MQATKIDYDTQARKVGLIVGISEEIYFCSLSHVSTVYVERIDDHWECWRENYIPNMNRRKKYKVLASGEFDYVIARTKNYLKYMKSLRRD
ncbi:pathogenicity island protein [Mammaliicoccus sciuri]|uniref:pathogenicity island protein n=1 Tax=Mammaliicoccus sciuri TaxID=1296 RepID=UPI00289DB53E|nr:pathogenicity island protein [Mammaliicoccus sciuri]